MRRSKECKLDLESLLKESNILFSSLTDDELISLFNRQVEFPKEGIIKLIFQISILIQFLHRRIDLTSILTENGDISYHNKVELRGKKVYLVKDKS